MKKPKRNVVQVIHLLCSGKKNDFTEFFFMIFKKIFVTTIFFREIALPFFDYRTETFSLQLMLGNGRNRKSLEMPTI